jgi:hypothetical protein
MTLRKLTLLVLASLCFATLMLYLLVGRSHREAGRHDFAAAKPAVEFSGRLDIRTMTDLRVHGRKMMLCGVLYAKPASMEPLVREQARRMFQGTEVECVQVGGGTPCDGRAAPSFDGAIVAQCRTKDGSDIARKLSDSGYLCDLPAQSGGVYHAC